MFNDQFKDLFKAPQFNPKQFADFGQAHLEKSLRLTNIALSSVERLVNLQIGITRDLIAENAETTKTLAGVKDVQGLVAFQRQLAQPSVEKSLTVARNVFDAASATQQELNSLIEEQVLEFNKNLLATLEKATENAPAGSGVAVNAMRNVVETASHTYDAVSKTSQKIASELVNATVNAAEAGVKVVAAKKASA
ncbi:phasin family protein [Iodobacter ciconiae]|uniref:Phasin family protein n=1 Tax=Iodobacter ciconiae TaxID=2496266 RepID=A0A3S8ZRY2_9NEIS|nr:phasin family protein [Iodobacter ciconiae]AZN36175.1 phasin family protein [Iodobacter ciconiae]